MTKGEKFHLSFIYLRVKAVIEKNRVMLTQIEKIGTGAIV